MNDLILLLVVSAAIALAVLAVLMPLWVWLIYRSISRIEQIARDSVYGRVIVVEPEPAPKPLPKPAFKQLISPPPSRPRP